MGLTCFLLVAEVAVQETVVAAQVVQVVMLTLLKIVVLAKTQTIVLLLALAEL